MSKIDNIFKKVISDADFRYEFDVRPEVYKTINDGCVATNPYVKSVAKVLLEIEKQVSEMEREQRIRNLEGKIELPDTFKAKLYKIMIKELSSESNT
jgi:6-pyruvoyl-tetrahydropterin synthase